MMKLVLLSVFVAMGITADPSMEDTYSSTPFAESFAIRRQACLEFVAHQGPVNDPYAVAARMLLGRPANEPGMLTSLEMIDSRRDCADFRIQGILRVLYQFRSSPLLTDDFRARARDTMLRFKYWPDEPGIDSMCSWSENHFILFASAGYLAGQIFPEDIFVNSGQTGREKMAVCRPRIERWLDLRFRTGFSEWLSNFYYEEDLAALLNLVDFCEDAEIAERAAMVIDLILLDIALNSFRGAFGCTHGRAYEFHKKWPFSENTAPVAKLMFGMNTFQAGDMAASSLALSERYRMPQVIYDIAADVNRPEMLNMQRMGLRVKDAKQWGLDTRRLEDGMTFLTFEAYAHPRTINLMVRMLDEYRWWDNSFFSSFGNNQRLMKTAGVLGALPAVTWFYRHDVQRNTREEVNIYTYRTPDYMLSSAQDYRKGFGGDQQSIWQATLGPDAVCFTTHPVKGRDSSPDYWTGSGILPRVGQVKNVAIIVYKLSMSKGLYVTNNQKLTHAWFPSDKFDQVVEKRGWIFARKNDAYLALWSQQPFRWQTEEGQDKGREIIADGLSNIWICELGSKTQHKTFENFVDRITGARIDAPGLHVLFDSPSQGLLEFGWKAPLKQNDMPVPIRNYPRYENPFVHSSFPSTIVEVKHGENTLTLDWDRLARAANVYVEP